MYTFCACGGLLLGGLCNYCGKGNQMITYKDKGWCYLSHRCTIKGCYRKLSEGDFKNSEELGLPIAYSDFNKGCFKEAEYEE